MQILSKVLLAALFISGSVVPAVSSERAHQAGRVPATKTGGKNPKVDLPLKKQLDRSEPGLWSYGQHFPNGKGAVDYIYGRDGHWKALKRVEHKWEYYGFCASGNHHHDKAALVRYSDGTRQTTAGDANCHRLLDFNHDGEIDVSSGGFAFWEHSGKTKGGVTHGAPFSNFWYDDNYLSRFMSRAYNQPEPFGLSQYDDFNRFGIIGGETDHWRPYRDGHVDRLALDGLHHLAIGDVNGGLDRWREIAGRVNTRWGDDVQKYHYDFSENYHLGLAKILVEKLIIALGDRSEVGDLIQHSVSLRSRLLDNQERQGSRLLGWVTDIDKDGTLMNTESIVVGALGLGAGGLYAYEAGQSPLQASDNGYVRDRNVLSAVEGRSKPGYMTYGPYQKFDTGSYNVDFFLRSSRPTDEMARIEVYDSKRDQVLGQEILRAGHFADQNQWTRFTLQVHVTNSDNSLEFRLEWHGGSNLDIAYIQVR